MPSVNLPFHDGKFSKEQLIGKSEEVQHKYKQLLEWHGVDTEVSNAELIGDCPFHDCPSVLEGKSGKFSCNRQEGKWQCFMCGRTGNKTSFLWEIHRNWLEQTTVAQYNQLRELRKFAIDVEELQDMQVVYNGMTDEWVLPAWNMEGKISNLYLWREFFDADSNKKRRQFFSSPMMHQLPYGLNRLRSDTQRKIWIVEGHWDYLAIYGLFRRLNLLQKFDVLAVPGAKIYPDQYLNVLNGRKLILCFDNDKAGTDGMDALIDKMARKFIMPSECSRVEWPSGLKSGFDVSDVVTNLPQGLWPKKKAAK